MPGQSVEAAVSRVAGEDLLDDLLLTVGERSRFLYHHALLSPLRIFGGGDRQARIGGLFLADDDDGIGGCCCGRQRSQAGSRGNRDDSRCKPSYVRSCNPKEHLSPPARAPERITHVAIVEYGFRIREAVAVD